MTPAARQHLRALAAAASQSPWKLVVDSAGNLTLYSEGTRCELAIFHDVPDLQFSAAAREAVPALLDEIERLQKADVLTVRDCESFITDRNAALQRAAKAESALREINIIASPDGGRTFDDCIRCLDLVTDQARAILADAPASGDAK